jgi:hypothetical protein
MPVSISNTGLVIDEQPIDLGESSSRRSVQHKGNGSTIVYTSERNAAFKISNGKEVTVDLASLESKEEIVLNLLGPLLRLVLLQRGEFVLHASVVQVGAQTALFIAPSGHGKSTIAAGLYDRGYDVLSDDTGIVRFESGPHVLAGPSVLKLHAESAARIDRGTEPVFSDELESGKRFYYLTDNETPDRTSLDVAYLLKPGDTVELESVSARDATMEFVANSWRLPDEDNEVVGETFQQCSELAEAVTVNCIRYPRSFEVFDDVLNRIEEDNDNGG